MAEPARSVTSAARAGVVRPISRAADRRCSRPGCPAPATATLAFRYDQQYATLTSLEGDGSPETYDLCGDHADRTRPPHRWTIEDHRPADGQADDATEAPAPADLGSPQTVAVLAAALRGDAPTVASTDDEPLVNTAALDAIVDEPFDDPSLDLYGTTDEADPVDDQGTVPDDALSELSALSETVPAGPDRPARTVPGARRPD